MESHLLHVISLALNSILVESFCNILNSLANFSISTNPWLCNLEVSSPSCSSPQINETLPQNFKSGILTAFKDEQEAVEFYHRVAREYNIPYISNQFSSNASDEQNHAVWFLFFINQYW